jgi:hypothetical protein
MRQIVRVHFPDLDNTLIENTVTSFYRLRQFEAIEKRPATRELINWIRALNADPDFKPQQLASGDVPFLGVLFKKSQDYRRAAQQIERRRFL